MEKAAKIQSNSTDRKAKALLLFGLSLGYFMVLLDTTVVGVALPAIHSDFGGGITELQWVVNAYTITFAALLLSTGMISDSIGAKRVYLNGLALFFIASGLSALAPSLPVLIGLRAILGAAGAALMPASLSLIAQAFPDTRNRARALGIWAAVTGIAMAAGPVVGGIAVDTFGWPSIFLLNLPLAAISLIVTTLYVTETMRKQTPFDWAGQLTAITMITSLSFALIEGPTYGWDSPIILAASTIALLSFLLFVKVEQKHKTPLLPLAIFKNVTVSAGMLAGMFINIALSGLLFILPIFFQQAQGLSAHKAGIALLPLTIPLAFNPIFTGRMVGKVGPRIPMMLGFTLCAAGALVFFWVDISTSYALTLCGLLLMGFGISFTIPALMTAVISSVPHSQTGIVSGALNSIRQLGATMGIAVFGSLVTNTPSFTTGMHVSFLAMAIILLGGSLLTYAFVGKKNRI
ncbi:MFS transporter [Brevibacillus migulae]|uniref:MFS transporter n=1 Tax=Brevibacillus migulae TaxID=1644114 RepID=UPI001F2A5FA9|nr:MFS transporter [Brevibacillus migulae]